MKRVRVAGVLSAGLLLILVALMLSLTHGAQAATSSVPLKPILVPALSPLTQAAVTCNVALTTTASLNNYTYQSAAQLSPYSGLTLFDHVVNVPTSTVQAATVSNWFQLASALPNTEYIVTATPDGVGNYNLGMIVYDATLTPIYTDTDVISNYSATFDGMLPAGGPYYFQIFQASSSCSGGTFRLTTNLIGPTLTPSRTPTPTRTITPTPGPFACATGSDKFEPNNDFDTATTIGLGVKYDGLNFVECVLSDGSWDNDFFKVRVKPGMLVTCSTLDLSPGTDTNLILYDNEHNGINGSDDVNRAAGDLSSSVSYYVTYEGWLYGLVGEGFHRPESEQASATYSYQCLIGNQSTATPSLTPTFEPGRPTNTPVPPTPTDTPIPSPTLSPTPPFIVINPLPTPTLVGLPTRNIPVSLQVYYDANDNNKPDPGEGISGVSARVFDLTDGKLLAQGLTDETGRVSFTVTAVGAVQLVVPYFNYSTIILPTAGGAAIIRISPRELPRSIP
jgi:hypothetical protein